MVRFDLKCTISMPTRMLETILEAKLGDDGRTVQRKGEDLAVNELEDHSGRDRSVTYCGCIVPVRNTGQYICYSGLLQARPEGDGR